jgi:hypothetical protein
MSNRPVGAERRRTVRIAGGVAAALTAGLAMGCGSSGAEEPVTGTPSSAPSSTPTLESAGTTPPGTPATASARPIPDAIPASAFLQASDVPGKAKDKPHRLGANDQPLPAFCGKDYEQKSDIGVRGTSSITFGSAGAPADAVPAGVAYEDVIVFTGDGATAFMTGLRAAVRGCASDRDDGGVTVRNYLRGPVGAGDDSELIERTRPATNEDGTPAGGGKVHRLLWVAVRSGDAIAFVTDSGWESLSATKDDAITLGRNAAKRLAAWR